MMANFDRFSKPPVDPSTKLGFWDKLKYILHGKCQIRTRKSLEVAFKGSRDPYDCSLQAGLYCHLERMLSGTSIKTIIRKLL